MSSGSEKLEEICLFMIAVLVICFILKYYNLCKVLFRGTNRAGSAHRIRNQVAQRQFQMVDEFSPDGRSPQLLGHGFEFYRVQSLPTSQFRRNEEEEEEGEQQKPINGDCAICLGEFEEGEWLRHLPNCGHGFHVSCIDRWFQSNLNCPLCRTRVHIDLAASPLPETLRREDYFHERAARSPFIRTENLAI